MLEVRDDWEHAPFEELMTVKQEENVDPGRQTCPKGYYKAFNQYWHGTNYGCDCTGVESVSFSFSKSLC